MSDTVQILRLNHGQLFDSNRNIVYVISSDLGNGGSFIYFGQSSSAPPGALTAIFSLDGEDDLVVTVNGSVLVAVICNDDGFLKFDYSVGSWVEVIVGETAVPSSPVSSEPPMSTSASSGDPMSVPSMSAVPSAMPSYPSNDTYSPPTTPPRLPPSLPQPPPVLCTTISGAPRIPSLSTRPTEQLSDAMLERSQSSLTINTTRPCRMLLSPSCARAHPRCVTSQPPSADRPSQARQPAAMDPSPFTDTLLRPEQNMLYSLNLTASCSEHSNAMLIRSLTALVQ